MSAATLEGKVALITGASKGIGRAIAERLGAAGALVAVHFSGSHQGAQDAAASITAAGGGAFLLQADLSAADAPARLVADLIQELEARKLPRAFDIFVNNAGVSVDKTIQDTSEEEFERTFAVNVRAPFFVTKAALPLLREGGRIVNLSSGLSQIAFPDDTAP